MVAMKRTYPLLDPHRYDLADDRLSEALDGVDAVLVHEWNDHELIARLGHMRLSGSRFVLLFHDTHHRLVTDPDTMAAFDLSGYDGVLAFGLVLRDLYLERSLIERAFVWHEAADTEVFRPFARSDPPLSDLVFIGNWGDDERQSELAEFFFSPVADLGLSATVHGVRYPPQARQALKDAGIEYAGWAPQFRSTAHLLSAPSGHPRAPSPLCAVVARYSHHPGLRSARLQHPARLLAVERCRALFTPGKISRRRDRPRHETTPGTVARRRRLCPQARGARTRDNPFAPYVCPSREQLLAILAKLGAPQVADSSRPPARCAS